MPMIGRRPGRVVSREVAEPGMPETSGEVLSPEPESIDGRRVAGVSELSAKVTKTHPLGSVWQKPLRRENTSALSSCSSLCL